LPGAHSLGIFVFSSAGGGG